MTASEKTQDIFTKAKKQLEEERTLFVEDIPMADIAGMAAIAGVTVPFMAGMVKTAWNTGKGMYKIGKIATQAGVKLSKKFREGYKVMPPMDTDKYPEMPGLEGPFTLMSGKVVYYDPKEGAYYDKDTDMYMTYDEFQQHDNDYSNMKDERDDVKEVDKSAIDAAVAQAMSGAPQSSPRPKARPKRMPRPKARPTINIGSDPVTGSTRGIDPRDNYSPEDLKRLLMQSATVRRDGKTLSKSEIAKLQRQGVLMKEDEEEGMIVYVGDQKFEYSDYTLEDAMRIVDEYADEMEGEPYEVYNADGKLVASGTMRSGAFHEPGIEEGTYGKKKKKKKYEAVAEGEEKPYICVHAKKGKHECRAESSYAAAKKAAEHWGLKSTSGIDAHLAIDEGDGRKKGIHPKGHPMRKKQQAAIHAGESKLQDMRKALELSENTDANTVVAQYTRACLDHRHNTWGKVCEEINHVRSFVKEDIDIENVKIQIRKMHEQENLDYAIQIKENVDKLRQIVQDKSAMSIKFADGSMKVDMTTASIFLQVFDKVKEETQAKIIDKIQTKAGFLGVLDKMYSMIG